MDVYPARKFHNLRADAASNKTSTMPHLLLIIIIHPTIIILLIDSSLLLLLLLLFGCFVVIIIKMTYKCNDCSGMIISLSSMLTYEEKGNGDSNPYCCSTTYADEIGRNFKIHAWKGFTGKEKEREE